MSSILLVDDDDTLRDVLRENLRQAGHTVLEAENGVRALKISTTQPWDVMVTDIIMPDKEGFETIAEIREKFPNKPIIAMSGGGHVDALDYLGIAKRLGASITLQKPFPIRRLVEAIAELVKPV
jgi:CheY-like chemotaxis protein